MGGEDRSLQFDLPSHLGYSFFCETELFGLSYTMKNDAVLALIHMDANAAVNCITIVCHLFSTLLRFELDSNLGREDVLCVFGGRGGGGPGSAFDMVISMKSLRILLNNTFTSGIEPLQSVLGVSSQPHLPHNLPSLQ